MDSYHDYQFHNVVFDHQFRNMTGDTFFGTHPVAETDFALSPYGNFFTINAAYTPFMDVSNAIASASAAINSEFSRHPNRHTTIGPNPVSALPNSYARENVPIRRFEDFYREVPEHTTECLQPIIEMEYYGSAHVVSIESVGHVHLPVHERPAEGHRLATHVLNQPVNFLKHRRARTGCLG